MPDRLAVLALRVAYNDHRELLCQWTYFSDAQSGISQDNVKDLLNAFDISMPIVSGSAVLCLPVNT